MQSKIILSHLRSSAVYLMFSYITVLGFAAFLDFKFPTESATFINFLFPTNVELSQQPFIRYRMTLWLTATLLFLIISVISYFFWIPEINLGKIQKLHWGNLIFTTFLMLISWAVYPIISLCTTCWTGNDVFYFLLTVSFFCGLQIIGYAIVVKAKTILQGRI